MATKRTSTKGSRGTKTMIKLNKSSKANAEQKELLRLQTISKTESEGLHNTYIKLC